MEIEEYSYNLVKKFMTNCTELHQTMVESSHYDIEKDIFSDYHLESVWTHTLMVYSHMIEKLKSEPRYTYKELLMAALLHDIGKPSSRIYREDKNKFVFYSHDNISTVLAIDIIKELDPDLSDEQRIYVLRLINNHQILFDVNDEMSKMATVKMADKFDSPSFFHDLGILRYADFAGNISKLKQTTSWKKTDEIKQDISKHAKLDRTKPIMTLMMGIPGSGKSTFLNDVTDPILSRDSIIMELSPGKDYDEAFDTVDQKEVDRLHDKRLNELFKGKKSFVLDRTSLAHKGRMKFITDYVVQTSIR